MRSWLRRTATGPASCAQIVPWLLPGDALSNDALAIGVQLAGHGPATLHCRGPVHPGLAALVTAGDPPPSAKVIVHLDERQPTRVWRPAGAGAVVARAHSLTSISSTGQGASALRGVFDLVLANSSFTAQTATDRGAAAVSVVPPFLPLDAFVEAGRKRPEDKAHGSGIAVVGPLRSTERLLRCVMVDHVVRTHFEPNARLLAIGRTTDADFERAGTVLCDELRLGSPWRGHLGQQDYVDAIASAGVLVHDEGSTVFGSAIVEAMACGTPVVACAGGAAAETLGGAGVLLPADADVTFVAEAVGAVLSDGALRVALRRSGQARAGQLAPAASADALHRALAAVGWW